MTPTLEDEIRTTLRRRASAVAPPRPDEAGVRRHLQRRHRRRRVVPAIGAVALIAAGIVVTARQDDDRTSTAAHDGEPAGQGTPAFTGTDDRAPYVSLPGWQVDYYVELHITQTSLHLHPQAVASDGERRAEIMVALLDPNLPYTPPEGPTRRVDINGSAGVVGTDAAGLVKATWDVDGAVGIVAGEHITEDDAVLIARGLEFDAAFRVTAVTAVPDGMTVELLPVPADEVTHGSEYQFVREGRRLQLHLYDGGAAMYDIRVGGDVRSDVQLFGLPASLLDYGNGRFGVDVLIGDHTFEFDGEPFASADDFLATAAGLVPADAPPPAEVTAEPLIATANPDGSVTGTPPAPAPAGAKASATDAESSPTAETAGK